MMHFGNGDKLNGQVHNCDY